MKVGSFSGFELSKVEVSVRVAFVRLLSLRGEMAVSEASRVLGREASGFRKQVKKMERAGVVHVRKDASRELRARLAYRALGGLRAEAREVWNVFWREWLQGGPDALGLPGMSEPVRESELVNVLGWDRARVMRVVRELERWGWLEIGGGNRRVLVPSLSALALMLRDVVEVVPVVPRELVLERVAGEPQARLR